MKRLPSTKLSIVILALALTLSAFTSIAWTQNNENLLSNPGFENGNLTGWTDWGCDLALVFDPVHTGHFSLLVYNRTQNWQGPVQSIINILEEGKTYRITGWVRMQNASQERIGITINQVDAEGSQFHAIDWSTGYNDEWVKLSGDFTLNVNGSLNALNVYFEGPAPGINFYLDDAQIVDISIEPPEPNAIGTVDVNTVYQTLEGFGASGAWYEGWLLAHPLRNEIYDVLFAQLGLDIYRLRNTYDISNDYITNSATIVSEAESSLGHPIKIMISSWSPPAYLKSNGNVSRGTLKKDGRDRYMYDEFAMWWVSSLVAFSNQGIVADYLNIQNEPDYLADWDSCKFTPTETESWAGYNRAFEAVYQKLDDRMMNMPKLLAGEGIGSRSSQAFIDALIDPNHAYGYAHHLYGNGDYNNPDSFIPAMESFSEHCGDKPIFQTEYSCLCDAVPFDVALNLAKHMHNSLVHEGVSAYFYWSLFWVDGGGLVTLDNPWQANPGYTIHHTYYVFKQFSAFTDPGWRRIEASTDSTGLRISAFLSPDANDLTIVIINVSDIDIDLTLSLGNFLPESSSIYRTSETDHTAFLGTFDQSRPLRLNSETITTLALTCTTQELSEHDLLLSKPAVLHPR